MIQFLLIFVMFVELALVSLVLKNQVRDRRSVYFAIFVIAAMFWSLGDLLMLYTNSAGLIRVGVTLFLAAPSFIPLFVLFFATIFPEGKLPSFKSHVLLTIFPALLILLAIVHPEIFMVRAGEIGGHHNFTANKLVYGIYGIYFATYITAAIMILFSRYRRIIGHHKAQTGYALVGIILTQIPSFSTNLAGPLLSSDMHFVWAGPLAALMFISFSTIAIIKHRLFDLRLVVARSLGYLLSLVLLASIYGFLTFGIGQVVFGVHFAVVTQVALSAFTGVAALSFARIKKAFDKLTNRLFYRDAYDPQELFDSLNRTLVSTLNMDKLLRQITTLLSTQLKVQYCLIGLKEIIGRPQRLIGTQQPDIPFADIMNLRRLTVKFHNSIIVVDDLDVKKHGMMHDILIRNGVAVLVRLTADVRRNEEGLGYLVLGPKKSGNPYTSQDVRVLDTIANELIIAIQNALHFEEIQNFNKTLQEKVVDATKELRRTNDKLKALDETKDDFISMASHQLRTPLTSVKGYLSMVLDGDAGKLTALERKMLTQAFISSQRMVYLISDLLNVSRLKTGKFVIERAPVNLADVISDEIAQLKEAAATRDLTLLYDKPKAFPAVALDETKTRQVVMNFIDNAIYYTPAGGHIRIELDESPATVELRVIDDGIGVPKNEQHHLFTKFYRAGNARQARPDGTGLGLFMARKVVIAQNGSIIFKSTENKGSTFGFSLPKTPPVTVK